MTSSSMQRIFLARHGETAWSISGQHTGLSDIPLTTRGERAAVLLGHRLQGQPFSRVWTSPLQRAQRTSQLAGFQAQLDPDLVEWNYGQFDGKILSDIQKIHPGWNVFADGCPGGESVADVAQRADRVVSRWRAVPGDVLVFSSGHILRALAARWLGLPVSSGRHLLLNTASLSILGFEHPHADPVIRLWNDENHLINL